MARVADYTIISDGWISEIDQDTINFSIPSTIDTESPSILGFMLHVNNVDDTVVSIHINGTKVWDWNYGGGDRFQFFQEVITSPVLKAGQNKFKFDHSGGVGVFMQVSDVVIWWQAKI